MRSLAAERRGFARRLTELIVSYGHKPGSTPSVKPQMHRAWIDLRRFLEHHDPKALVSECLRAEKAASVQYQAAMRKPLPLEVERVLSDQLAAIRSARVGLAATRRA